MRPLLAALAIAVALAGCGGSDKPDAATEVRATLQAFVTAVEKHQYQRLCDDIFAPKLLASAQSIGLPCEVAMRTSLEDVRDPKLTIGPVTVKGRTASAEVKTAAAGQAPSTDVVRLELIKKKWRVSALGDASPTPTASPTEAP